MIRIVASLLEVMALIFIGIAILNNIGEIYLLSGDSNKALENYRESLKVTLDTSERKICRIYNRSERINMSVKTIYEEIYKQYSETKHYIGKNKSLNSIYRMHLILNQVNLLNKYGKILDIGCAEGYFGKILLKNGYYYVGLDISLTNIKNSIQIFKNTTKPNFILCDAQFLPFRNKVFDVIICSEVIEHLYRPQKMLKECNRILKSFIIISTPCVGGILFDRLIFNTKIVQQQKLINERIKKIGIVPYQMEQWRNFENTHIKFFNLFYFKKLIERYFNIFKIFRGYTLIGNRIPYKFQLNFIKDLLFFFDLFNIDSGAACIIVANSKLKGNHSIYFKMKSLFKIFLNYVVFILLFFSLFLKNYRFKFKRIINKKLLNK